MIRIPDKPTLGSCLLMDGLGMLTYLVPGVGEWFDLVWAVVAGVIFYRWFGSTLGAVASASEELAPFTDIVPAFTIAYLIWSRKR